MLDVFIDSSARKLLLDNGLISVVGELEENEVRNTLCVRNKYDINRRSNVRLTYCNLIRTFFYDKLILILQIYRNMLYFVLNLMIPYLGMHEIF